MGSQAPEEESAESPQHARRAAPRFDVVGDDRISVEFAIEDLVRTVIPAAASHCAGCTGCNGCKF
jgi:hypothetical protein